MNRYEEPTRKNMFEKNAENPQVNKESIIPPLKRLRKKTTPSSMHVTHNNNITIAYATSLATTKIEKKHYHTSQCPGDER